MITRVFSLCGGSCRQFLGLIDRQSWHFARFQARILVLEHSKMGIILVDTGYGTGFEKAASGWPHLLYRLATPVSSKVATSRLLQSAGVDGSAIRHVILTHFHADHVGGLSEFPSANFYHHEHALAPLQTLSPFAQVRAAFLPALVPLWFPQRAISLPEKVFALGNSLPLPSHDLFGDGSLRLLSLPGHAPGQIGVAFEFKGERLLYAADAFWNSCQLATGFQLPWITRKFHWDPAAYEATLSSLRLLHASGTRLLACHDDSSMAFLPKAPSRV